MSKEIDEWTNQVHQGDAHELLKEMPDNSVDLVVTSPPYWGQRYYGVENEIGVEEKAKDYVKKLVSIFDEIYRVLDGSLFLNISDTYNGNSIIRKDSMSSHLSKGEDGYQEQLSENRKNSDVKRRSSSQYGIRRQSRLFIPSRIASKMSESGWRCRDEIIWSKTRSKPEGRVNSRFYKSHEKIYRFVTEENAKFNKDKISSTGSVWEISIDNSTNAHPAPFPKEIVRRAIKTTTEENDIVLDPFIGSGTTAVVAQELDRNWIGIDLNKDYIDMSFDRIENETKKIFDERSILDF